MACGDGDHAAAASADRAGVRVVGEDGTRSSQLVDQVRVLDGCGDLYRPAVIRCAAAGREVGEGGDDGRDVVSAQLTMAGRGADLGLGGYLLGLGLGDPARIWSSISAACAGAARMAGLPSRPHHPWRVRSRGRQAVRLPGGLLPDYASR